MCRCSDTSELQAGRKFKYKFGRTIGLFFADDLGYTGEHVSFAAGVKQCQGFRKSFTFSPLGPFLFNQIFGGFVNLTVSLIKKVEICQVAERTVKLRDVMDVGLFVMKCLG